MLADILLLQGDADTLVGLGTFVVFIFVIFSAVSGFVVSILFALGIISQYFKSNYFH